MSELAFDSAGEPFEVPRNAVAWAVRRVSSRGGLQRIYSGQGLPLFLPITVGIEEFRRIVQVEGRYFLDPVDEHQRRISLAKAAYVWLRPQPAEGELAPGVPSASPPAVAPGMAEALTALSQACAALAQQITAVVPVLAGTADALVRTSQDAEHGLQAIRDLMR